MEGPSRFRRRSINGSSVLGGRRSCQISTSGASPGGGRVEVNFDTGPAVTVIPLRYGSGNEVGTETTFRTASGDAIRDAGRCILSGKLRTGTRAELRGRLAPVHRVLASETEVCKNQYAVLDQNGGICRILIPRRNGERIRWVHEQVGTEVPRRQNQCDQDDGAQRSLLLRHASPPQAAPGGVRPKLGAVDAQPAEVVSPDPDRIVEDEEQRERNSKKRWYSWGRDNPRNESSVSTLHPDMRCTDLRPYAAWGQGERHKRSHD